MQKLILLRKILLIFYVLNTRRTSSGKVESWMQSYIGNVEASEKLEMVNLNFSIRV